jgi:hypothetical protein
MRRTTSSAVSIGGIDSLQACYGAFCKRPGLQPAAHPYGSPADRSAAGLTVCNDWHERLVCSKCGSREIDMVVTGTQRRRA